MATQQRWRITSRAATRERAYEELAPKMGVLINGKRGYSTHESTLLCGVREGGMWWSTESKQQVEELMDEVREVKGPVAPTLSWGLWERSDGLPWRRVWNDELELRASIEARS